MGNQHKSNRNNHRTTSKPPNRAQRSTHNEFNAFQRARNRLQKTTWKERLEATGIVLAALAAGTYMKTCAIQREATDNASIVNRPVIEVINPRLTRFVVGQVPQATVILTNSGPTPAVDVQSGSRLQVGARPMFFHNTAYEPSDEQPVTLGSHGRLTLTIPGEHPLTADEATNGLVKVHGEIVYCAPGSPEPLPHVHFCFQSEGDSGGVMENCDPFGDHGDNGRFRNALNCRAAK